MFNNSINKELAKLDVLESKLNIYETLSREMLDKLENAVDKISESNQRIANILAKHDERIEQAIKTDDLIVKMIEDAKHENAKEHERVNTRLGELEKSINEVSKFKWQAMALVGAGVLITSLAVPFIDNLMGMSYSGGSEQVSPK
ncbi:holin-like protein [Synechococcus phage S-CREM1]|nr:holin-like protein [Synechococcus phage S-CREM1]